jgi:hypothetical protein
VERHARRHARANQSCFALAPDHHISGQNVPRKPTITARRPSGAMSFRFDVL